jgi:hypothetical protein
MSELVLDEADWGQRARLYSKRVDELVAPHLRGRTAGEPHPVWDFLFTYYSLRPRQLRVWHPGFGVVLRGRSARSYLARSARASPSAATTCWPAFRP